MAGWWNFWNQWFFRNDQRKMNFPDKLPLNQNYHHCFQFVSIMFNLKHLDLLYRSFKESYSCYFFFDISTIQAKTIIPIFHTIISQVQPAKINIDENFVDESSLKTSISIFILSFLQWKFFIQGITFESYDFVLSIFKCFTLYINQIWVAAKTTCYIPLNF